MLGLIVIVAAMIVLLIVAFALPAAGVKEEAEREALWRRDDSRDRNIDRR